jgi:hypothetical protein
MKITTNRGNMSQGPLYLTTGVGGAFTSVLGTISPEVFGGFIPILAGLFAIPASIAATVYYLEARRKIIADREQLKDDICRLCADGKKPTVCPSPERTGTDLCRMSHPELW